jgi:hypothetical protein
VYGGLGEGCLNGAMRLFRLCFQAIQVSLPPTLPVYIPCTPRAIDGDVSFRFSHVSFRECWRKIVCSSGCLQHLALDLAP